MRANNITPSEGFMARAFPAVSVDPLSRGRPAPPLCRTPTANHCTRAMDCVKDTVTVPSMNSSHRTHQKRSISSEDEGQPMPTVTVHRIGQRSALEN